MKRILTIALATAMLLMPFYAVAAEKVGGVGKMETIGSGDDAITMLRLAGTRHEMGYWYGYLLANQIAACSVPFLSVYSEDQYKAAVTSMWNSQFFDTASYEAELKGMAEGCAANGHPEMTFEKLQWMQMVPDMSETGCGLYALWGKATANGHLYQLRNLDWSMDTGAQNYPVVAFYEPIDGNRHAVVGFAGLIGGAIGGISSKGVAVSEIMGGFGDPEGDAPTPIPGVPFTFLLRECLYHDSTLAQSLSRISGASRTNQYYYCISGKNDSGEEDARLLFTSHSRINAFGGGQTVLPHPHYSPFYTPLEDAVYWKRHDGGAYAYPGTEDERKGNQTLYAAINSRYGSIDDAAAIEIARADGVSGTVASIVYDVTALKFWVAFANGTTSPATTQNYVEFDFSKQPSAMPATCSVLLTFAFALLGCVALYLRSKKEMQS